MRPVHCLLFFAAISLIVTTGAYAAPEAARSTLKNGLRVVIVRDTLAPVATVQMNYLVGANETPAGFPGMAHAEEHMMFRGSPGLSAAQLANISASMGGRFNANTQPTVTQYFFTVPSEDLELALRIGAIRMRGVLNSAELWQHERGAIEQEVARDLSNPQYLLYTKLLGAVFAGTPYARSGLGTRPSFEKTTAKMLKAFHDAWYTPNNAVLVIAGDVEPGKTLAAVKRLFGNISARKLPPRQAIDFQPVKATTLHSHTDLPYGMAVTAFRLPGVRDQDFAAARVLANVLNSQRAALYALRPQGKALYGGFQLQDLPDASLGYAIAAFPKGADSDTLVKTLKTILRDAARHGVAPDLVTAAKRQVLTAAEQRKNSVAALANAWSQAVAIDGRESPAALIEAIQGVTVADVNRVAKQYLNLDHAVVAVLTPQASGKAVTSKSFGGKESFAPRNPKPVKLPKWAGQALAKLRVPESVVQPVVSTLDNGIRLIVQPETVSDTVSVYGRIQSDADMQTPPGTEGVGQVLDRLFDFGSEKLGRLKFQRALDEIGASESAGTDFSLTVLSAHFDRGVELLAANELHPALPAGAFKIVQAQLARELAGVLQSPDYLFQRALQHRLLPKGDPRLRQATPDTVRRLKLGQVRGYYEKVFRPDMTSIVVIGNVKPKVARATIEKYFGGWKAAGKPPAIDLPAVPMNEAAVVHVPNSSRVQDQVVLAEMIDITRSNSDYYALNLGNHVLGGGFYATRLYRDLRANAGLVYSVSSDFVARKTRAFYEAAYGADPDKVARARAILVDDLKTMREKPVTPGELHRAKAMLLREIPLSESSIDAIAGGLLHRVELGLPLDEPIRAAHHYLKLDAAAIQAAFKKYLRPDDLVMAIQGPKPE